MNIAVLGAGFMGSGIAQVCAAAGHSVALWDMTDELTAKGIASITKGIDSRIAKGKSTVEYKEKVLGGIHTTTDIADAVAQAEWVVEVIVENIDIKRKVLAQVEALCGEDTVISSNTSSIPITQLAAALKKPGRFLGTHFFSPVPAMKLVEIISGEKTAPETAAAAKEIVAGIGKTGVVIKDSPGFLVNRINYALRMEAYRCLEEGIASVEDIDTALKLGLNHPMGPFELNDMAGLDIGLAGLDTMYKATNDPRWKPIDKVREMVAAGELGKKTGKGWYDYSSGEKRSRTD